MNNLQYRTIFFHQQSTSARTRFLFFTDRDSVLGFSSLPELSVLLENNDCPGDTRDYALQHRDAELKSSLQQYIPGALDNIELNSEFLHLVDIPNGLIAVSLARFTTIDPPFEWVADINAEFRELTALRTVCPPELELLQSAYKVVMG